MFGNKTNQSTKNEKSLTGKNIAILSCDGFEQSELFEPKEALEKAGASVKVISPKLGSIKGWNKSDWGKSIDVDLSLEDANAENFDAVMLPGGVMNPDKLRLETKAVEFVKSFFTAGKPVAAICHGPQTLIETGLLEGKTLTSWPSLKTDITNAGATWVDQEVSFDQGLITSRKPDDIPAFNQKMIEVFSGAVKSENANSANTSPSSSNHSSPNSVKPGLKTDLTNEIQQLSQPKQSGAL